MSLIGEEDKKYLREEFSKGLIRNVELLYFADKNDQSDYNLAMKTLLLELVELNEYLTLTVKDCSDKEELETEGLELCPAIKVKSVRKGFVNFYGMPAGYEFSSLVEDIIDMGSDKLVLPDDVIEEISEIDYPIDLKVFITAACPYCPKAVRTAHLFSMVNENIRGSMVDANGFPDLSMKFMVTSVPHIMVNDRSSFVGALPPREFLAKVKEGILTK